MNQCELHQPDGLSSASLKGQSSDAMSGVEYLEMNRHLLVVCTFFCKLQYKELVGDYFESVVCVFVCMSVRMQDEN